MNYLFIDPGKEKFGYALYDENKDILEHRVLLIQDLENIINNLLHKYSSEIKIIIGNGTGHKEYTQVLSRFNIEIKVIDEKNSTMEARILYFEKNRRKGIKKFIPVTLLVPPVEYDDYTAMILANRYFDN